MKPGALTWRTPNCLKPEAKKRDMWRGATEKKKEKDLERETMMFVWLKHHSQPCLKLSFIMYVMHT